MSERKGVIYILTNPSFEGYVKIGYADDVEQRGVFMGRQWQTGIADCRRKMLLWK